MRASIYYGPEDIRATNIQDPRLNDDHAMLVEVSATSICGSDLHVYRGALDAMMEKGRSQTGHELIGRVKEIGKDVGRFKPCLLYTSPSPRDRQKSRMPSSA